MLLLHSALLIVFGAFIGASNASPNADWTPVHALVTGGSGFIGSHIASALAARNSSVITMDNYDAYDLISLKRERSEHLKKIFLHLKSLSFEIEGDVCNATLLQEVLDKNPITHVLHFARIVDPVQAQQCLQMILTVVQNIHVKVRARPRIQVLYARPAADTVQSISDDHQIPPTVSVVEVSFPIVYGPWGRTDQLVYKLGKEALAAGESALSTAPDGQYIYIDDAVAQILSIISTGFNATVRNAVNISGCNASASDLFAIISKHIKTIMSGITVTGYEPMKKYIPMKTSLEDGLQQFCSWLRHREKKISPCVGECSSPFACFDDQWTHAAVHSRRASEGCATVLYTVSTTALTSSLWQAPPDSEKCNFAFLGISSELYNQILRAQNGSSTFYKYKGWTIIPVNNISSEYYHDSRKPSRVPKINPGRFFASSVQYAVYGDASIRLLVPVQTAVTRMKGDPKNGTAVFVAVEHPSGLTNSVFDEFDNVVRCMSPGLSFYPHKISEHRKAYLSYMSRFKGIHFDNMFDGGLLLHDLRSAAAKEFRCRWYRQFQEWTDRDQLSGPFVIGTMNYEYSKTEAGRNSEWISIGELGGHTEFVHILSRKFHPQCSRSTKCLAKNRKDQLQFYAKMKLSFDSHKFLDPAYNSSRESKAPPKKPPSETTRVPAPPKRPPSGTTRVPAKNLHVP